jgi:hypothetical protein
MNIINAEETEQKGLVQLVAVALYLDKKFVDA